MYFFDTYAIIEVLKGNPNYAHYEDFIFIVTHLNIGELYLYFLRANDRAEAEKRLNEISFNILPLTTKLTKSAVEFKHVHRAKKLSWADCIGYATAQQFSMKFLTGDSQFKGLPSVEFVK